MYYAIRKNCTKRRIDRSFFCVGICSVRFSRWLARGNNQGLYHRNSFDTFHAIRSACERVGQTVVFSQNMAASKGSSMSSRTGVFIQLTPYLVAKFKILNFFWHLYAELNLDEIKNALHNLLVNRETNLMDLIRP